ncbi:MAG: CTP synthase, partial [Bacteroidota bacterium]
QGFDDIVLQKLGLEAPAPDLKQWSNLVRRIKQPSSGEVRIGICGKYTQYQDAYKSIIESFIHAGAANNVHVDLQWIDSEGLRSEADVKSALAGLDGLLVAPGFGSRGVEGKIMAIRYVRQNGIPFFGICLGMQCATIEYARNVCGLADANSAEFAKTPNTVIDLMADQKHVKEKGGTMRLGSYPCIIAKKSRTLAAYREQFITERHRHRYEVNNAFRDILTSNGLVLSGVSPDGRLVEIIEIPDHPWFIGCQFHPELKSRLLAPHPLFKAFVKAAMDHRDGGKSKKGTIKPKARAIKESTPKKPAIKVKDDLPLINGNGYEETADAVPTPEIAMIAVNTKRVRKAKVA